MHLARWIDEHGNIIEDPKLGWKTLSEGVATTIFAAFDPSIAGRASSSSWFEFFVNGHTDILQSPTGPI